MDTQNKNYQIIDNAVARDFTVAVVVVSLTANLAVFVTWLTVSLV